MGLNRKSRIRRYNSIKKAQLIPEYIIVNSKIIKTTFSAELETYFSNSVFISIQTRPLTKKAILITKKDIP